VAALIGVCFYASGYFYRNEYRRKQNTYIDRLMQILLIYGGLQGSFSVVISIMKLIGALDALDFSSDSLTGFIDGLSEELPSSSSAEASDVFVRLERYRKIKEMIKSASFRLLIVAPLAVAIFWYYHIRKDERDHNRVIEQESGVQEAKKTKVARKYKYEEGFDDDEPVYRGSYSDDSSWERFQYEVNEREEWGDHVEESKKKKKGKNPVKDEGQNEVATSNHAFKPVTTGKISHGDSDGTFFRISAYSFMTALHCVPASPKATVTFSVGDRQVSCEASKLSILSLKDSDLAIISSDEKDTRAKIASLPMKKIPICKDKFKSGLQVCLGGTSDIRTGTIVEAGVPFGKHDVNTEPGHSGSPLINSNNQVVGVHIQGMKAYSVNKYAAIPRLPEMGDPKC
jgi:hypothetical protein